MYILLTAFLVQDAAMSRGSGYGASAADDSPADRSWDADSRYRHAAQHSQRSSSLAVPTDSSRHAGNRASSQQSKQQYSAPAQQISSRHDYAGSGPPDHLQAREASEHHGHDLDKPRTGQRSGQVAAGPTDSQRPQHQEHQHRFEAANDSRWPAEGPEKRQARHSARPAAKPYATDQSLQVISDMQMCWHFLFASVLTSLTLIILNLDFQCRDDLSESKLVSSVGTTFRD